MKLPIAILLLGLLSAATAVADEGERVYNAACIACHGSGVSGAPKLGDKPAWAPRIRQGKTALDVHALHGFGWMPPKGGYDFLSDAKIRAAVDYMSDILPPAEAEGLPLF